MLNGLLSKALLLRSTWLSFTSHVLFSARWLDRLDCQPRKSSGKATPDGRGGHNADPDAFNRSEISLSEQLVLNSIKRIGDLDGDVLAFQAQPERSWCLGECYYRPVGELARDNGA